MSDIDRNDIAKAIHDGPSAAIELRSANIAVHPWELCPHQTTYLGDAQAILDSEVWKKNRLPDPKGSCSCFPHWEPTGGVWPDQYLPEYDPACPEHSVHLYDPKLGEWILRDGD